MHMADALISPAVAGVMYAASAGTCAYSIRRIHLEDDAKKIPVMGVMGAFVFAAQMINFTIPGTGSSGHMTGALLLGALLGPYAGFVTLACVLLIQCLFFADGGLLALGCNVWNMAFYGCFIGTMLIWRPLMKKGASKKRIFLASVAGCVISLQLGALSVCLETFASGITELPLGTFLLFMQPIHLAIGLVEGLITAAVLCFVYEARPEMLWEASDARTETKGRLSYGKTLGVLGGAAVVIACALSLLASALPDGLEWSIENIAGSFGSGSGTGLYAAAESIQSMFSVFADYSFSGVADAAGTSISGLAGTVMVFALCIVICLLLRSFRKKRVKV